MSDLQEVSLFSGIGGISLGLERAGVHTALLCEQDKHARGILQRHYPHAAIHNDVTELTADDCRAAGAVPGRTVLTAGWPCQGNSVAGARGGMDDPRSGLWSHVVRLLAEHRPAWFIGENVPGLLSVNDGRDFSIVVHDLAKLGYGFTWRILDARHFGVPQRRGRDEGALPEIHGDGSTVGSIRAAEGGSSRDYIAGETVVRRLTSLELERLQGFPDGWTEGQADSHRSKQLGNSVAVPVFEWVGRRLVAVDNALAVAS